jgi:hypothetical protein
LKKKSKEFNFNTEHKAAKFIVSQVNKYPGEVVILCLGAMTNVATALSLDSSLVSKIKVRTHRFCFFFFSLCNKNYHSSTLSLFLFFFVYHSEKLWFCVLKQVVFMGMGNHIPRPQTTMFEWTTSSMTVSEKLLSCHFVVEVFLNSFE